MFRFRCPHCGRTLQALEIRAGKMTVCSACSRPLTIPADKSHWLTDLGEPAAAPQPVVAPVAAPAADDTELMPAEPILVGTSADLHLPTVPDSPAPPFVERREPPRVERRVPPDPVEPPPPPPRVERPEPAPAPPPPRPEPNPTPTPARQPGRLIAARPAPPPPPRTPPKTPLHHAGVGGRAAEPDTGNGMVSFTDPAPSYLPDLAADLTAMLTTRMKPPPQPPRDLRASTAIWLLTTGLALILLAVALFTTGSSLWLVGYIGLAQLVAGYAWVVWIAFRRDPRRGLLATLPPVALWFMMQSKYARFRPLRFALTGVVLMAAAALAYYAQPHTQKWAGVGEGAGQLPPAELAAQPKLVQLRVYRDQRAYGPLIALLRVLAKTDPTLSEDAWEKPAIAAELKALCLNPPDTDVKVEALAAYALWGGDDARAVCLDAVRSPNQDERIMALRLLPQWKDDEVARAIAARIGRPNIESSRAREALERIGGSAAERAVIPLLRSDDQSLRLTGIDILGHEKVGGPAAVTALKELAAATDDPATRQQAMTKAKTISDRLKK